MIAAAGLSAGSASAATINVFDGDSIQRAVISANRGDRIVVHPGTYRGAKIKKNKLTLKGAGGGPNGAVIKAGHGGPCGHGAAGICIGGQHGHPTVGTRVSGFRVQGFKESGAIAFNARSTTLHDNVFLRNDEYGAAAFSSNGTRFVDNVAKDSEVAGFYVGDSPHAKAVVQGNVARHNREFGLFLRDSSHAVAAHNRVVRNCIGVVLLNTGAPGGVHDWSLRKNRVLRNQRRCPSDSGPPDSGTGIALAGATHNVVRENVVNGNRPKGVGSFPGGIVVFSSTPFGGSNSAHNRVVRNRARHNQPADIIWDGKGKGNLFNGNRCAVSQPGGLCG
jgi:nitrous oxidase accessory protein NosD